MQILQIKKKVRKWHSDKAGKTTEAAGRFVLAAQQKWLLTFQQV